MGTPTSSSDQIVDYVLGKGSLFRPLTAEEYRTVIDGLLWRLKSRLRYYGFRELHIDRGDQYDRVVAKHLSEHVDGIRLKQVYVEPIRPDGRQSMFYISDKAEWLMVTGHRDDYRLYDAEVRPWAAISWMYDLSFDWLDSSALAEVLAAPDTPARLGFDLCNGLWLILQDAVTNAKTRLEDMQRDTDDVGEIVKRLQRLASS